MDSLASDLFELKYQRILQYLANEECRFLIRNFFDTIFDSNINHSLTFISAFSFEISGGKRPDDDYLDEIHKEIIAYLDFKYPPVFDCLYIGVKEEIGFCVYPANFMWKLFLRYLKFKLKLMWSR